MDHNMMMDDVGMNMHSNSTMMMMMMMQMYFTADEKVTLLFKQWKTTTVGELFGTCVFCFFMAMLYEGFKSWRLSLIKKKKSILTGQRSGGYGAIDADVKEPSAKRMHLAAHSIQTLLHMFQLTAGYLLMLAVMTYNVWIGVSIILGSGLGYFIFSWAPLTMEETMGDHCNM